MKTYRIKLGNCLAGSIGGEVHVEAESEEDAVKQVREDFGELDGDEVKIGGLTLQLFFNPENITADDIVEPFEPAAE